MDWMDPHFSTTWYTVSSLRKCSDNGLGSFLEWKTFRQIWRTGASRWKEIFQQFDQNISWKIFLLNTNENGDKKSQTVSKFENKK